MSTKIDIGQSSVNKTDLDKLQTAWKDKHLVLFLGAGVSIPYGVQSWKDLVLELLFQQTEHTRRLGGMLPHYRRAVASWMTDYFDYNPLVLARMVERDARKRAQKKSEPDDDENNFLENLRTELYKECATPANKRTALQSIADLIKLSKGNIRGVVTFNFDGLLEEELEQRKFKALSIINGIRQPAGKFRIIHPHGFVPRNGKIDRGSLIFTEDDYHKLTDSVFHWGLSEIVNELRHSTVLFIGLSMSDPSLRRLLDASNNNNDGPSHWLVQQRHQVGDITKAKDDIESRAQWWGEKLSRNEKKFCRNWLTR